MLVVDASVFVAAARPSEPFHVDSDRFISRLASDPVEVTCPCLAITEIAAALARTTGDASLVATTVSQFEALPGLHIIGLSPDRARLAADAATTHRLRGADAVYVQAAIEVKATLVTWDGEMLTRGAAAAPTMTPTAWLAANPVTGSP